MIPKQRVAIADTRAPVTATHVQYLDFFSVLLFIRKEIKYC